MTDTKPYILVVDDNKITTRLLRRYLEAHGFDSGDAGDGIECLESLSVRRPNTIFLDVMMPRLDGIETVRAIKANPATKTIPVVIVTALNDVATQSKAVEAGADDFLTKPIEEKLLITKCNLLTELDRQRKKMIALTELVNAYRSGKADESELDRLTINAQLD